MTPLVEFFTVFFLFFQLGGTIGDIEGMPFVEAFRQFQFRVKRDNFVSVHVSLVPQVSYLSINLLGPMVRHYALLYGFHTLQNMLIKPLREAHGFVYV